MSEMGGEREPSFGFSERLGGGESSRKSKVLEQQQRRCKFYGVVKVGWSVGRR
jgi:hypothetical protein